MPLPRKPPPRAAAATAPEDDSVTVRLRRPVHAALVRLADAEGRKIQAELERAVKAWLERNSDEWPSLKLTDL